MDETQRGIPTTVLRDNRERRPWTFEECALEIRDVTLTTGDYAVPTDCTHDPDADTYYPEFAVERKSGDDFLTALTWERDRFGSELQRATEWAHPLAVVVETSWERLLRNRGCMKWRDIHPNQIAGTVSAWTRYYNVEFYFTESRRRAELCGYLLLVHHSLARRDEES